MADVPAISVRAVAKKYCPDLRRSLRYGAADILSEFTLRRSPPEELRDGEFWALEDINFDLAQGESLGIIGRNGAGKSTLLRLLAGVTKPDRGEIRVSGRVGSLLSLGAGFDATLTGRENILIEGAAHGMGRRRLRDAIDQIVDFAELGDFIEAPVHTYSDGMRMRLGFAVATSMSADILLLDEVLIVGDINFRQKSVRHVKKFIEHGGSVVFVSHEMWLIQAICNEAIHLTRGRVTAQGPVHDTINHYYAELGADERLAAESSAVHDDQDDQAGTDAPGGRDAAPIPTTSPGEASDDEVTATIDNVVIHGPDGGPVTTGQPVHISAELTVLSPDVEAWWGFTIWTPDRIACITAQGSVQDRPDLVLAPGLNRVRGTISHLPLRAGTFRLSIGVLDQRTSMPVALTGWNDEGTLFSVETPETAHSLLQKTPGALIDMHVTWADPEIVDARAPSVVSRDEGAP